MIKSKADLASIHPSTFRYPNENIQISTERAKREQHEKRLTSVSRLSHYKDDVSIEFCQFLWIRSKWWC